MIIGSGNIAKVLKDRDDLVFFASGVSNSSCTDELEFKRERDLLATVPFDKHLVYFSNLGVYYKKDRYTQHKIDMESIVRNNYNSYTIVRIEVCEWVSNPTTILNVFKEIIQRGEEPEVRDTTRYVLSLDEFLYWVGMIQSGVKNEMNILGRKMKISEIVKEIKNNRL